MGSGVSQADYDELQTKYNELQKSVENNKPAECPACDHTGYIKESECPKSTSCPTCPTCDYSNYVKKSEVPKCKDYKEELDELAQLRKISNLFKGCDESGGSCNADASYNNLKASKESLASQLMTANQEKTSLTQQLSDEKAKLTNQINTLTTDKNNLTARAKDLNDKLYTANTEKDNLAARAKELNDLLYTANVDKGNLTNQLNAANNEKANLSSHLSKYGFTQDLYNKLGDFAYYIGKPFQLRNKAKGTDGNWYYLGMSLYDNILRKKKECNESSWYNRSYYCLKDGQYNLENSYNARLMMEEKNNDTFKKSTTLTIDKEGHIQLYDDKRLYLVSQIGSGCDGDKRILFSPNKDSISTDGGWTTTDVSKWNTWTYRDGSVCLQSNPDLVIDTVGDTSNINNWDGKLCSCSGRGAADNTYDIIPVETFKPLMLNDIDPIRIITFILVLLCFMFIIYSIYYNVFHSPVYFTEST